MSFASKARSPRGKFHSAFFGENGTYWQRRKGHISACEAAVFSF
jgi:hypothetical protein